MTHILSSSDQASPLNKITEESTMQTSIQEDNNLQIQFMQEILVPNYLRIVETCRKDIRKSIADMITTFYNDNKTKIKQNKFFDLTICNVIDLTSIDDDADDNDDIQKNITMKNKKQRI